MSELVDPASIEAIVGWPRQPDVHMGRYNSDEGRLYILHSQECLGSGIDLRECEYSIAMDRGDYMFHLFDAPMSLYIYDGRLMGPIAVG
jgi:hypothetical protein